MQWLITGSPEEEEEEVEGGQASWEILHDNHMHYWTTTVHLATECLADCRIELGYSYRCGAVTASGITYFSSVY